jgi:hypothetical protein
VFGAEVIGTQETPIGRLTFVRIGPHSEEIRQRLGDRGAADDFVTDFGPVLSVFFSDPDGLECEVCVTNPDAVAGVNNPPGTRAAGYPAEA